MGPKYRAGTLTWVDHGVTQVLWRVPLPLAMPGHTPTPQGVSTSGTWPYPLVPPRYTPSIDSHIKLDHDQGGALRGNGRPPPVKYITGMSRPHPIRTPTQILNNQTGALLRHLIRPPYAVWGGRCTSRRLPLYTIQNHDWPITGIYSYVHTRYHRQRLKFPVLLPVYPRVKRS